MADEKKATAKPAPVAAPIPEGHTRVKIWVDDCFSSVGRHKKGEIIDLPDDDAALFIEKELAQEVAK